MLDMDTQQSLMLVAAFLIGAGIAWGAASWWFGRRLKGAAAGLERVEKARQFAAQQAAQARKQIETLQHEMGELRQKLSTRRGAGVAPPPVEVRPAPPSFEPEPEPPAPPPDGFADTQVLMPPPRR